MPKLSRKISIPFIFLFLILIIFTISPEKKVLTQKVREASGSEFLELSEGLCEYEIGGPENGKPVILVHGLSVPYFDWDRQFSILTKSGFRVLRYNQYGRGLSDRPKGLYNAARYVRQLKDIMDSQGWTKVDLIVHSMGGAVAAQFNKAYPNAVDKIVLLSPVLHMAENNSGVSLVRIPVLGDLMAKTALSGILSSRADELFDSSGIDPDLGYSDLFREQTRYFGFSRSLKSLFRNDMVDDLSDIYKNINATRALLIWGSADTSVSEEHIQRISAILPQMDVTIFDGVGHMPNMEKSQEVNALILDFLK